jgi:membrane protein YqaA with SNARE-associated domain
MSEDHSTRNYITAGGIIFFIILWTVLSILYTPKEIVEFVGITNGYILTFLVAVMGALSSITTFSIYPMIITFALGDLNPLLLGIIAGIGLSIGDFIFYYFGFEIKGIIKGKLRKFLKKFFNWLVKRPPWQVFGLVYLYVGFTPFPNNLLTGTLAVSGYPFKKIIIPVAMGDITLPLLIIYLARAGVEIF